MNYAEELMSHEGIDLRDGNEVAFAPLAHIALMKLGDEAELLILPGINDYKVSYIENLADLAGAKDIYSVLDQINRSTQIDFERGNVPPQTLLLSLGQTARIGTTWSPEMNFEDYVSPYHATITADMNGISFRDNLSFHGTEIHIHPDDLITKRNELLSPVPDLPDNYKAALQKSGLYLARNDKEAGRETDDGISMFAVISYNAGESQPTVEYVILKNKKFPTLDVPKGCVSRHIIIPPNSPGALMYTKNYDGDSNSIVHTNVYRQLTVDEAIDLGRSVETVRHAIA